MKNLTNKKFMLAILIFLILIFLLFLFWPNKKIIPPSPPFPTPSASDDKTRPVPDSNKKTPLKIVSSKIPNRTIGLYEGFTIEFSQSPSASGFLHEITPFSPVRIILKDRATAFIGPRPTWNPNTEYRFTIKKGTKDIYGNLLEKDFVFTFKTVSTRGI